MADEVRRAGGSRPGGGDLADRRNVNITNRLYLGLPVLQFPLQAPPDRPGIRHHAGPIPREDRPYAGVWAATSLLLQGGLHPQLRIDFYERLFSDRALYPYARLHALVRLRWRTSPASAA